MCTPVAGMTAFQTATLAIGAASTAASVGMGIMSANVAASNAQAQMNLQAQQMQQSQQMQRQSMIMQQQQASQQMALQQRQQQQAYNLQTSQANANLLNQHRMRQQQVLQERAGIMAKFQADKLIYQRSIERFDRQTKLNDEAANRSYVAEQAKMNEARKKAAFEQQTILAKSIGAKGTVLAAGRTGQSVGLLVNDIERQAGFTVAQENAMLRSKEEAAFIGMDQAYLQAQSANENAFSQISYNPQDPYLPEMPDNPILVDGNTFAI